MKPIRRSAIGSVLPHKGQRGAWLVTVSLGKDVSGRRRRLTKVVRGTKEEAERAKIRMLAGHDYAPARLTVSDYLRETWLPTKKRATTQEQYEKIVRLYIEPSLGKVTLQRLAGPGGPLVVERWLRELSETDLSPGTVKHAYAVFRAAMRQAARWRIVEREPTANVEPPTSAGRWLQAMEPSEALEILTLFRGHRIEPAVVLGLGAGLRRGEALGLRWSRVNLDTGELRVEEAYVARRAGASFGPPKSATARRTVTLPAWAVEALRAHRKRQSERRLAARSWHDLDMVIDVGDGRPMQPGTLSTAFRRHLVDSGKPVQRFHDLRHGFATLLHSDGEELGVISDLLGHSDVRLTKSLYAGTAGGARRRAAKRLDVLLGG